MMTKYSKVSRTFWKGRGFTFLYTLTIVFLILQTINIFLYGFIKPENPKICLTVITVIYILINVNFSVIRSMHPVLAMQNQESSWLSPSKPADYIALIPVSRKNIINSYIQYINYTSIILFLAMTGFAFYSINNIFDTSTCTAGNVMFIWISFLIPVKDKTHRTTKIIDDLISVIMFSIFFLIAGVIAVLFENENQLISAASGMFSLLAEARAVIMLKKYQKKLLDTSLDYSLSGEIIGKEKTNA